MDFTHISLLAIFTNGTLVKLFEFCAELCYKKKISVILKAYLTITCQIFDNQQIHAFKTPREHSIFYTSKLPISISYMLK